MHNLEELKKENKLSEEENEVIFQTLISPLVFDKKDLNAKPRAVFAGGQSGSGKYAIMCEAKRERKDSVIITTDNYKPFHPKSEELKQKYPVYYVPIVDQDAGIWTGKCLKKAIDERYSFIFEGTLKNTRVVDRMKESKENGFEVVLKVMAVSDLESLLSIFERYEKQIEVEKTGRLVSIEMHNDAYFNLPNTVDIIEKSNICDVIEVYVRGESPSLPNLVYSSNNKNNKYSNALEAILSERNTNLFTTKENIIYRLNILEEKMVKRNASKTEFEHFNILKEYIRKTLDKDTYTKKKIF